MSENSGISTGLGLLFFILILFVIIGAVLDGKDGTSEIMSDTIVVHDTMYYEDLYITEVVGTYYNAVSWQCDATPFTTADGSHIDITKLQAGEIKWLAVSQDMLKKNGGKYNYGDTVYLYHSNPKIKGKWVIHDCMNRRFTKRIDFLLDVSENSSFPGIARNILMAKQKFYE